MYQRERKDDQNRGEVMNQYIQIHDYLTNCCDGMTFKIPYFRRHADCIEIK